MIGAGTIGVGIAYVFAAAGCRTLGPDAGRTRALLDALRARADCGVARGKLTPDPQAVTLRR